MVVFHGSYCEIEHPDISFSRDKLDFGRGFYLTPLKEQAERWCTRYIRIGKSGYVNVYELDEAIFCSANLKIKNFAEYNEEWLDYIFACRQGKEVYQQYDVVTGGIANDKIFATIDSYFAGYMSKEMALDKLKYEKPNHQICILDQEALDMYLHFKESIKLN
ncbi:MAG: DUF3990 domain-containing protein [Bacteroidaceae bacterium]|nr:DUF3990 domain-containing protein [Bacteroidaceae bacterium]